MFHLITEITECSPVVRGLLENKTLKEFGTSKNTKENIITCPEYVDVRQRIVFVKNPDYVAVKTLLVLIALSCKDSSVNC